ncbi:MAG TPA: MmgE/PrpD family protein, partial [Comamonas sp.]
VRLEITTRQGSTYTKVVQYAKGDPKNPMSPAEYEKKFFACTTAARMPRQQAQNVLRRIQHLEQEKDVSALQSAMAIAS